MPEEKDSIINKPTKEPSLPDTQDERNPEIISTDQDEHRRGWRHRDSNKE